MNRSKRPIFIILPTVLLCLAAFPNGGTLSDKTRPPEATPSSPLSSESAATAVYLPTVQNTTAVSNPPGSGQLVNAPYFSQGISDETGTFNQTAIFWFGSVDLTNNYADVRVGYTPEELYVHVAIFDRLVWYDKTAPFDELDAWDATSLYINLDGNQGNVPSSKAYRFTGQVRNISNEMSDFQEAFQGTGSGWKSVVVPFTTDSFWRGGPNDEVDDGGWRITYRIPFSSLALSGPPPQGSVWGLGVVVHDRDDSAGSPIADKAWPTAFAANEPGTWGRLGYGLPTFSAAQAVTSGSMKIQQGLNGAVVPDGTVGGWTDCGHTLERFTAWGVKSYPHIGAINVQNQYDVVDFPCFSKYYITFPLDQIPLGKVITSASLTVYQFSNAGLGIVNPGPDSYVQVSTIAEDWDEETLAWNNAPQAQENVSQAWVPWMAVSSPPYGTPRSWDLLRAAARAYEDGEPLRLALYSADAPQHTGKYFWSSDYGVVDSRPYLYVTWGEP